jgi:hypothetical protein
MQGEGPTPQIMALPDSAGFRSSRSPAGPRSPSVAPCNVSSTAIVFSPCNVSSTAIVFSPCSASNTVGTRKEMSQNDQSDQGHNDAGQFSRKLSDDDILDVLWDRAEAGNPLCSPGDVAEELPEVHNSTVGRNLDRMGENGAIGTVGGHPRKAYYHPEKVEVK